MTSPLRLFVLFFPLVLLPLPAAADNTAVFGRWLTESGNAHVELYRCADPARGFVCGKVVWLRNAINPDDTPAASVEEVRDVKNPDPALRARPILGLEFLHGFQPSADEPGTFTNGKIYNAEEGETYSARIRLEQRDRLVLRGFVLMPMLGKSQTWARVQ